MTFFNGITVAILLSASILVQGQEGPRRGGPTRGGAGGPGPGGMMAGSVKLLDQFDSNRDQWLNAAERKAAREFLAKEKAEGRGPRRPGFRAPREGQDPPTAGPKLGPGDVKEFPGAPLYDEQTVRTLFLDFENADWEAELGEFYNTDVDVPAKLTVDGKTYQDVGVQFRGASSFFTVPEGRKRSLNLSMDLAHKNQALGGYRTLDLLNAHSDPTFLRTVLYNHIAREYIPAPKANYVRLVINGESWGIYVNTQQFNKDFIQDYFSTTRGPRWKVPGSPRASGGLEYLGDEIAPYRRHYEIKTKDEPQSWNGLIRLCRVLNKTPIDQLEAALDPILNVDGVLKFLALENVFINNDGYWIRSSDYNIYQDSKGRFHIFPHDANETFRAPGGLGFRGGVEGMKLDPLTGTDDPSKPLLSKLLAVPSLKARYLGHVRQMAETWLDWKRLGSLAEQYHNLIAPDVEADTRKLYSFEAFEKSLTEDIEEQGFRGPRRSISLKSFADQRREYLLAR